MGLVADSSRWSRELRRFSSAQRSYRSKAREEMSVGALTLPVPGIVYYRCEDGQACTPLPAS